MILTQRQPSTGPASWSRRLRLLLCASLLCVALPLTLLLNRVYQYLAQEVFYQYRSAAEEVVKQGIHMTIYVVGHRSFDGKLLPFKKGPFYLAEQCRVPVVPVTISGTHYVMPKRRFSIKPGLVTIVFHKPIEPAEFGSRVKD